MPVAEILAGAALVKASIDGIKSTIGAAKDISQITTDLDNLFTGAQQIRQQKKQAKATGQSATEIVIQEELAKEAIEAAKQLIMARWDWGVWQKVVSLQKEQALAAKHKAAADARAAQVRKEELESAATVGASLILGILVVTIIALVVWAMQ